MLSVESLRELFGDLEPDREPEPVATTPLPWRVLLWTVDPETRIGRDELLEAVGRPPSWLYRHTAEEATDRIPHRKLDGQLVFVVGEVRRWLREREEIIEAGPIDRARTMRSISGGIAAADGFSAFGGQDVSASNTSRGPRDKVVT